MLLAGGTRLGIFSDLACREYWQRVWVLQGFAVAGLNMGLAGDFIFFPDELDTSSQPLRSAYREMHMLRLFDLSESWDFYLEVPLQKAIAFGSMAGATDPRYKDFGEFALVSRGSTALGELVPDYSFSICGVFCRAIGTVQT